MIIIKWVKYHYKGLTTGINNSPDIFQQKMIGLFQGFKFLRAYIEEILVLIEGDCIDHIKKRNSN